MRAFTDALFLLAAACTLLPLSFAEDQAFVPAFNHGAKSKSTVIRGLLVRQSGGCDPGFVGCSTTTCCPTGWNCCSDGNCCDPSSLCVLASNGVIGCCPIGQHCSGPAGDPTTILPSQTPPTPTSNPFTALPPTTTPVSRPTTSVANNPFTSSQPIQTILPTTNAGAGGVTVTVTPTATSTGTGLPRLSAAGRAEPYQPLLVFGGILLAMLYCA